MEEAATPRRPSRRGYARVAVPVPLPHALTYEIPPALDDAVEAGVRVRVPVGRRRLVGVVLERAAEAPAGIALRPLEAVLDHAPVLPGELLDLARFVAEYYLAPIGDVTRALLPSGLPPWGDRKVWLTSAGAIAPPRDADEASVVGVLRDAGRLRLAELRQRVKVADLPRLVDRLLEEGRLGSGDSRRSGGTRYLAAVELPAGDLAAQLEACGRSPQGRAVVELLAELGRPALVGEVTDAVGCTPAVVRRLVTNGILRRFTQVERLSLERHRLEVTQTETARLTLRPDQARALERLLEGLAGGGFRPYLLSGITGSGKTEVYLRVAEEVLAAGRSAILMVPEIALVPALARIVEGRFGGRHAILHSGLTEAERGQEWERIRRGEARLVLGPRSAVFAPVPELGLIVIDEEQDSSYKQDSSPRYHGRDVALVRGRAAGAVVVAVSATPSLESRLNASRGKFEALRLTRRAGAGALPEGVLVDLRQEGPPRRPGEITFSATLKAQLEETFAAGDQVILLRNRRGYAPVLLCRACGEDMRCDDCGLPRTFHRREGVLLCHYCGGALPVPKRCPACGEAALEPIGAGTERVEETFGELFPEIPVGVLDRDVVRRPGGIAGVLASFSRGETRALVGTQMVAKGHHFPRVALAAVLSADTYLGFPDFRAVERTYNLLVQLAGRAGRGDRPGRVVIQTYHPDHYAIRAALEHDDTAFVEEEMRFRRIFHYPPFTRMVQLLTRDRSRERAQGTIEEVARAIARHPRSREVRLSGPAPAPFERLQGKWRFQLLIRGASAALLKTLLADVLPEKPRAELLVDVDPQDLL